MSMASSWEEYSYGSGGTGGPDWQQEPAQEPERDAQNSDIHPQANLSSSTPYYRTERETPSGCIINTVIICGFLSVAGLYAYKGLNREPQGIEQKVMRLEKRSVELKAEREKFLMNYENKLDDIRRGYVELQKDGALDEKLQEHIPQEYRSPSIDEKK